MGGRNKKRIRLKKIGYLGLGLAEKTTIIEIIIGWRILRLITLN